MITIRLFCCGGASTSILARKMRDAAAERGLEVEVTFGGVHQLEMMDMDELRQADVALIGPQMGYMMPLLKGKCAEAGVPVAVIPMRLYGMCDGKGVLEIALDMMGPES